MSNCLYCQTDNPDTTLDCQSCGMPLPAEAYVHQERREQRFIWFCALLTVFCIVMMVWLPRALT